MTYAARLARLEAAAPGWRQPAAPPLVAFCTGCPDCGAVVPVATLRDLDGPPHVVATACACGAAVNAFTLTLGERVLPAGGAV